MYLFIFFLFFSPDAFSQDLSQVLNLLQADKVPFKLSSEQCSNLESENASPETENISSDIETCLYSLCGLPQDSEIQKARERFADYKHPEAEKHTKAAIPLLDKRVLQDQNLLNSTLQNIKLQGASLLPENASSDDHSHFLGEYFDQFIAYGQDDARVLHDPYGELTENQRQILQQHLSNPDQSARISCPGSVCREAFLAIPEIIQYQKLVTTNANILVVPNARLHAQCRLAFHAEAAEVHHKSGNAEFLKRLKSAREHFLEKLKGRFSEDSLKSFEVFLREKGVGLNSSDEPFYDDLTEQIKTPLTPYPSQGFEQAFTTVMEFKVGDQLSPQAPAMRACEGEYLKPAGSAGDEVYLNQFSTFAPELGEQVYLHELGHMLSEFFRTGNASAESQKAYLDQRRCVAQYHSDNVIEKEDAIFEGDTTRIEEEMGDFYQSSTVSSERPPMSCMHFDYDLITLRYSNPTEKKPPGDEYSSNIKRLILEMAMRKKSLPGSCQNVAKKLRLNLEQSCL